MICKIIFLLGLLFSPVILFCEINSTIDLSIGSDYKYYFNLDSPINPNNILELPNWKAQIPLQHNLAIYCDNIFSIYLDYKLSTTKISSNIKDIDEGFRFKQYQEYQFLYLNELSFSSSLDSDFFNINLGKISPQFGTGYIRNSASYFEKVTNNNSKWMVNPQIIIDVLFFELYYAPFKSFIPDDYTDKETLGDSGDIIGFSTNSYLGNFYVELTGFYDNDFFIGLNSSTETPMGLMLYSDITFTDKHWINRINNVNSTLVLEKLDDPYFDILIGANYTPQVINWTFYLEGRYNQDGLTKQDFTNMSNKLQDIEELNLLYPGYGLSYYGELAEVLPFNSLSKWSLALHLESFDYILYLFKITNTTFMSLPIGYMNQLTVKIPLSENINLNCSWNHIGDSGEYKYFLYKDSLSLNIKYNLYK